MDVQINAPQLMAKIRDQAGKIAELELIRDAYVAAIAEADVRIVALEARIAQLEAPLKDPEPGPQLPEGVPV